MTSLCKIRKGELVEFKELKRQKDRGMSNNDFFDNSKRELIDSKAIVIVALSENGFITTYRTTESSLETLGMLEVAKNQLLRDMEE